jgi:steroid delta-isomerase-like uncharacterized protein
MATDNIALVRRLIEEVWNKGNLGVIGELIADKYVSTEPLVGTVRGPEALKQYVQTFRTAFPDLKLTIDDAVTSGDRVFLRWTARGTQRGVFMGIAPSNNKGEVLGMSIHRIVDGKIVEHHDSYDSVALLQIMGVVPPLERLMKAGQGQQAPMPRA